MRAARRRSSRRFSASRKEGTLLDLGAGSSRPAATVVAHDPGRGLISPGLGRAIGARLRRHEPVILFFNRRGYASSLVCPQCGFLPRCSRCSLPLSYHKREGKFVCHYCRFSEPASAVCPKCRGRLVVRRAVGVEAAAEELKRKFPGSRVEIFATDEAGRKEERDKLRLDFREGRIDILAGTQFLAHQADFPPAALVGILHPEFGLRLADFRSAQRTYLGIVRELRFLSGASGAEAFVQTSAPEHFSIREAVRGGYTAFYEQEITYRRLMAYPPFSALAEVNFMGARAPPGRRRRQGLLRPGRGRRFGGFRLRTVPGFAGQDEGPSSRADRAQGAAAGPASPLPRGGPEKRQPEKDGRRLVLNPPPPARLSWKNRSPDVITSSPRRRAAMTVGE